MKISKVISLFLLSLFALLPSYSTAAKAKILIVAEKSGTAHSVGAESSVRPV